MNTSNRVHLLPHDFFLRALQAGFDLVVLSFKVLSEIHFFKISPQRYFKLASSVKSLKTADFDIIKFCEGTIRTQIAVGLRLLIS